MGEIEQDIFLVASLVETQSSQDLPGSRLAGRMNSARQAWEMAGGTRQNSSPSILLDAMGGDKLKFWLSGISTTDLCK